MSGPVNEMSALFDQTGIGVNEMSVVMHRLAIAFVPPCRRSNQLGRPSRGLTHLVARLSGQNS
jgi:hypothetical protein